MVVGRGPARLAGLLMVAALALPASAFGHAERTSYFPNFDPVTKQFLKPFGKVPKYRDDGKKLVVCKDDSRKRILDLPEKLRERNLKLLDDCEFENIQEAVEKAKNNTRILVLPGVYKEKPSAKAPDEPEECEDLKEEDAKGEAQVPSYEYHYKCPTAQNLIAITGDDPEDEDRECDSKCNIQIEGTGRRGDVLISGDRSKLNVIRLDRADGAYLRNFTIQYSDFNNIYALETNGFVFDRIESRYSREYGFLSFASDKGLYTHLEAYGSGDSGIYPGSGPEGHCNRYGIEIRRSNSHHNNIGYSGTAGNGVWAHHNRFHHNSTGMTTDSFAAGHPGMPQDCAKWEKNLIYSNNFDLFSDERSEYCTRPPDERNPKKVCSTFQNPTGTGILIAGGNANIVRDNRIWDNWRQGVALLSVPTALRGEDPTGQSENNQANQFDTSHFNRFTDNKMGIDRKGKPDPNGVDFWWDEQGERNCWENNTGPKGEPATTDFGAAAAVSSCPGSPIPLPPNASKSAFLVPCATWSPEEYDNEPPGCRMRGTSWFEQPPEPE